MARTTMIIGKGAREHALLEAHLRSPDVDRVVVSPGNEFMAHGQEDRVVVYPDLPLTDLDAHEWVAHTEKPDLVEVAQDDVLAAGAVNELRRVAPQVFGPTREAAQLEADKVWSREQMVAAGVDVPKHEPFRDRGAAKKWLAERLVDDPKRTVYVKAAGLYAGKGALEATGLPAGLAAIDAMAEMGVAGEQFLIEEAVPGEELSAYAISDATDAIYFKSAQDNKRERDGDEGDQTGGMGATAAALAAEGLEQRIITEQFEPIYDRMREIEVPYEQAVGYFGLMLTPDGRIVNIEINARWGDPEIQAVAPGITSDYVELLEKACANELRNYELVEDDLTRVCIVGATKGYPREYPKGLEITGLNRAAAVGGVEIFGAAIRVQDGKFYSDGGRLFSVVGAGADAREAHERAMEAVQYIAVGDDQLHYRTDIGRRDIERLAERERALRAA